jgi:hypothetical protein
VEVGSDEGLLEHLGSELDLCVDGFDIGGVHIGFGLVRHCIYYYGVGF